MIDRSQINLAPVGRCAPTPPLKRGVTLVELMISMLILTIVSIAWLQIIGIQSARKEARRREAVERLVGMMDAFMYHYKTGKNSLTGNALGRGAYRMEVNATSRRFDFVKCAGTNEVFAVFNGEISPIGYQLCVVSKDMLPDKSLFVGWDDAYTRGKKPDWLVGILYDRNGLVADAGKPFFTLPVCLGM